MHVLQKVKKLWKKTAFLFVLLFLAAPTSFAQEKIDGFIVNNEKPRYEGAVADYINFYQDYLSPLKQGLCAMYPSCSNYGLMVYDKLPFPEATILLSDRLIRCSHDQDKYNRSSIYGKTSCIDFPYCSPMPDSIAYSFMPNVHTDILRFHPNDTLLFVNSLINKEEYQNALFVIQKAEFENKGIGFDLEAKKLLCYRGIKQFEKGVFEYETQLTPYYKSHPSINIQAALLYYMLGNDKKVINTLDNALFTDSLRLFSAHTIRGLAQTRMGNYDKAIDEFKLTSAFSPNQFLKNTELIKELSCQKKKNKLLAECLSIIPGLGYLYAGHPKSALTSLLINCALGYATYSSIKSQNYGVAGLCGFFTLSFYVGNITGAGRSAERYNYIQQQEIIAKLESINHVYLIN